MDGPRLLASALRGFSDYTLLIAKKDPGQGIVWAAFGVLIAGLAITFYLPRRRIWARLGADGRLALVGRSDRYVDFEREFGGLARRPRGGAARRRRRRPHRRRATPGDDRPRRARGRAACRGAAGSRAAGSAERRAARPIAWVRLMRARVPAFDALEPGDLVIVPASALAVVAPGADGAARRSSAALAAVPVSGSLLVGATPAGDADAALDALAAALAAAGLPLVRVDRTDAAAIERSVVGFLVDHGAELERQATLLEAQLEPVALEGGGVDGAARRSPGSSAARSRSRAGRGATLAVHAPAETPRRRGRRRRVPRGPAPRPRRRRARCACRARRPRPARPAPGSSSATEPAERARAGRHCPGRRAAGPRARPGRGGPRRRSTAPAARAVPAAGPPWVVIVARQREPGAEDDAPAAREAPRGASGARSALLAPARRMTLRGDAQSVELRLVAAGDADGGASRSPSGSASSSAGPSPISRPFADARGPARRRGRGTGHARGALRPRPTRRRLARADRLRDLPDAGRPAQPARRPAPGAGLLAPLLAAGRTCVASAWRRCGRSSTTAAWARPPPRSASTATPSPTGSAGSRRRRAGGSPIPSCASRSPSRSDSCKKTKSERARRRSSARPGDRGATLESRETQSRRCSCALHKTRDRPGPQQDRRQRRWSLPTKRCRAWKRSRPRRPRASGSSSSSSRTSSASSRRSRSRSTSSRARSATGRGSTARRSRASPGSPRATSTSCRTCARSRRSRGRAGTRGAASSATSTRRAASRSPATRATSSAARSSGRRSSATS